MLRSLGVSYDHRACIPGSSLSCVLTTWCTLWPTIVTTSLLTSVLCSGLPFHLMLRFPFIAKPHSLMQVKLAFSAACLLLAAISNCSTLTPPVVPLIVRNPYLSTWLGNARDVPWKKWPMFWTGEELGFSVLALVPDSCQVYPLLGRPHDSLLPIREGDG